MEEEEGRSREEGQAAQGIELFREEHSLLNDEASKTKLENSQHEGILAI